MNWSEFNAAVRVFMPEHNRRLGLQALIDRLIRSGCVDLQSAIPQLRANHTTEMTNLDLVVEGFASAGALPSGTVRTMYMVAHDAVTNVTDYANRTSLRQIPWAERKDMVDGKVPPGAALFAVSPAQGIFIVSPQVGEDSRLVLEWDGVRTEWNPNDPVRFPDLAVQAVSEYVLARVIRMTDKNIELAASHERTFVQLKRRLKVEEHGREFVRDNA